MEQIKQKEDYPLVLTAQNIKEILGVSISVAYALMDEKEFPCIRISKKLKRVNRDAFFEWMEHQGKVS